MDASAENEYVWLETAEKAIQQMLSAIAAARDSICLETYTFDLGPTGQRFRQALTDACRRGLQVKVMLDALGSVYLLESSWKTFQLQGGQFRWFNPISLSHMAIRDHRKLLVCDDSVAFLGGFNIAKEYCGDGVKAGWRDLGMKIRGPMAKEIAQAFEEMFEHADFKHKPFARLRSSSRQKTVASSRAQLLLGGPSRNNPIKRALRTDLKSARQVAIVSAYFLPPWRIRRDLMRLARTGARVQLILPGKSDVTMSRLAGQSFYRRLLKAGLEIYEYQPQILHAKLFIIDDIVYAGSANLDRRSLSFNYELMLRLADRSIASQARAIFSDMLANCSRIEPEQWRRNRGFLDRLAARVAYFILARLDPLFARRHLRD